VIPVARRVPTHDLERLKAECSSPGYLPFMDSAFDGRVALGWSQEETVEFIQSLSPDDFDISKPGTKVAGVWHDYYRKDWKGKKVFFKFVLNPGAQRYAVTSCKEDR